MTERARLRTRSGKSIRIRPLERGDAAKLRAFNDGLSDASRGSFLPHAYDDETLGRIVTRACEGKDLAYLAVDESDGTVAGYFFLWFMDQPVPVLGIGLADAYQGDGLGKPLMEILTEDARAAGKDGIELTTLLDNERAFHLYKKVGYRYLGDVDNVSGDGRVLRERRMFLPLRDGATAPEREHGPPA